MTYVDLFWHLWGFLLPALAMAPAMVLGSRLLRLRPAFKLGWLALVIINFGVCALVLLLGLLLSGEDGRMATYGALVLGSAACQTVLTRPGKRSSS